MPQNERLGDRRAELRFEILGDLWATFSTTQSLPLVNLGSGGALVHAPGPLAVGSIQRFRFALSGRVCDVSATIRHVSPAPGRADWYLVGLEFIDLSPDARAVIDAFVGETVEPAADGGEV